MVRHQDRILRVVGQVVRHRQDAEDLAAETFVRAWTSLSGLRQPELFPAWLNRIALNLARNHLRDGKVRGRVSLMDQEILEQRALAPAIDPGTDLRAAVAELPDPLRRLLRAKYEVGLSYREIAEREAVSPETIKDRLKKAREALEGLLSRRGLLEPRRARGPSPVLPADVPPAVNGKEEDHGLRL